ncbi:E3 ubiquitin-protein ligase rnf13 [Mortierella sp. AD094]|nr:E3 ubiquitin-protein ligase rnf13 [Mortierella sp. AD094]
MTSPRRFRLVPALTLAIVSLALSSNNLAHANIFGVSVAKLSFDRISVRNMPSTIGGADMIASGNSIPAGIISQTGAIPKGGFSGVLFDMGYACTSGFDANNTLPPPDFYGLPRIALIQRGGPTQDQACTFRTKLLNAIANNSIGAIIYTYQGVTIIDGATAALNSTDTPVDIPGMMITYDDGIMLRDMLQQTQDSGSVDFYNRVRVTMSMDQKMPIVWEFVLIIVVVLLAVSFTVSVVLHCRLYALRQRIRMDALARGADVLPNGTIRMRKITLDKAILDDLPVRVYGQDQPSLPTPESTATEAAGTTSSEESSNNISSASQDEPPGKAGTLTALRSDSLASLTSLTRANSLRGSVSGQSVRSTRAIAAATALDANTAQQTTPATVNAPTSGLDEATNETCAVCLDEFSDGEEIRTLPCRHEFHCECIDPWLTRKSSTCPLCKYDCMPRTIEEVEGRGEDANVVVPNDRFIEFVMGPDWVASRTLRGHNGTSYIDRVGHFFGVIYDRARGRPARPFPSTTISASTQARAQQQAAASNQPIPLDEHGQVPLQLITPNGVSIAPTTETSTRPTTESTSAPVHPLAPMPSVPEITIDMHETDSQSENHTATQPEPTAAVAAP